MRSVYIIVALIPALATLAHAGRYALLAGNSEASGNYLELKYVKNDIASLKGILSDYCGRCRF